MHAVWFSKHIHRYGLAAVVGVAIGTYKGNNDKAQR